MPRPARPWFRFYVEAIHDRKLRRMAPVHRWLWVVVLACARQSCVSGYLLISDRQAATAEDLADMGALRVRDVKDGLVALAGAGLIDWDDHIGAFHVVKWNDRQYESDDVTARTRRHRERSNEQDGNVPTSAVGTPPETEADTESDSDSADAPKRATGPPSHMLVTEPMREWARGKGLTFDLGNETDRFLDYHRAKGSKFKDWTAAWRTWMTRAQQYQPKSPASTEYR